MQQRRGMNIIGPQVKRFREKRDWSQSKLATRCQLSGFDISTSGIGQIEIGYRMVTDLEMAILSRILEVSTEDFVPDQLPPWKPRG